VNNGGAVLDLQWAPANIRSSMTSTIHFHLGMLRRRAAARMSRTPTECSPAAAVHVSRRARICALASPQPRYKLAASRT